MIDTLRSFYNRIKIALFGAPGEATEESLPPEVAEPLANVAEPSPAKVTTSTGTTSVDKWKVIPYNDPVFEKIGRVYLNNGDLVIRSDRDPRGFVLLEDDLDQALTGGVGTVRLLDLTGIVGTARFSTSGLAMNIVINQQLYTIPMRSLSPVLTGHHRKAPLFIPADALVPDLPG